MVTSPVELFNLYSGREVKDMKLGRGIHFCRDRWAIGFFPFLHWYENSSTIPLVQYPQTIALINSTQGTHCHHIHLAVRLSLQTQGSLPVQWVPNEHLLSTYFVPGTVLGIEKAMETSTQPLFWKAHNLVRGTESEHKGGMQYNKCFEKCVCPGAFEARSEGSGESKEGSQVGQQCCKGIELSIRMGFSTTARTAGA